MNKKIPLKYIVDSVSNEKGISKEVIFDAIKEAILYATKKKYKMLNVETHLDHETGIYKTYALYNVIEDLENQNQFKDIPIKQAKKYNPHIKLGEIIKKEIKSVNFGRIDAQLAKNIIMQRVKNAEREIIIKEFSNTRNKILSGIVKKETKTELIISINNDSEGIIKKEDLLKKDCFKIGDKIKACFIEAYENGKEIKLSRTCNEMIIELLRTEVPEIKSGIIEIKDIARDPGIKTKISVKTNSKYIDAIGTCLGIRGIRIKNISDELCGEKIDLIVWDENIIKYIINIFFPIEVKFIEIDKNIKMINIFIDQTNLSKIIGKTGKNIKLITKLVKWNLNINEYKKKS